MKLAAIVLYLIAQPTSSQVVDVTSVVVHVYNLQEQLNDLEDQHETLIHEFEYVKDRMQEVKFLADNVEDATRLNSIVREMAARAEVLKASIDTINTRINPRKADFLFFQRRLDDYEYGRIDEIPLNWETYTWMLQRGSSNPFKYLKNKHHVPIKKQPERIEHVRRIREFMEAYNANSTTENGKQKRVDGSVRPVRNQ